VTVCIAARSFDAIFLASDRMLTSGDVQFEPPTPKILFLTPAIAVMAAGDSGFHAEVLGGVLREVQERVRQEPENWWLVQDVVNLHVKHRNEAKLRRAEAALLAPLGLDRTSFIAAQKTMDSKLVYNISRDLIGFEVPEVGVIIAGIDKSLVHNTPHIYSIHDGEVSCEDLVAFRAIGSGARHAESAFMLASHAWNSSTHEAVLLTYCAKKYAEIAPGVGSETDMFMIGPGLGQSSQMRPELMKKLHEEYSAIQKGRSRVQKRASKEMFRYVESLGQEATAAQTEKAPEIGGAEANPTSAGQSA
jgi:20S proteasome alpha/beta subunit